MENRSDPDGLPYVWKIEAAEKSGSEAAALTFSWQKEDEPNPFLVKALANLQDDRWVFPDKQTVIGEEAVLENFKGFGSEPSLFTVKSSQLDFDGDGVPDIQEILDGSVSDDPLDYSDRDGDGVPDYIELLQNTNPANPSSYLDSRGDGISDYKRDRSVVALLFTSELQIPWGFQGIGQFLAPTVRGILGSGLLVDLVADWDQSALNVYRRGIYEVKGVFRYPRGVFDVYKLPSSIRVEVLPKPVPEDILSLIHISEPTRPY